MTERYRVGELRPSQILLNFGIGSVVDLPGLSVMIMGLNDWDISRSREIGEPRLLAAVQRHLGPQVDRLLAPPAAPDSGLAPGPFDESLLVGVPVATFPRWVVCPACRLLAPLSSGLFELHADSVRPDRTRYVHRNCNRSPRPPAVNPARFLVACERGHLDDFPWAWFVHRDGPACAAALRFSELGASGEAAELQVMCDGCGRQRRMVEAFGDEEDPKLPGCRGRRPHLRDHEENCSEAVRAILLGASNSWFPVVLSALSVPSASGRLEQLVESHWPLLGRARSREIVTFARETGQLAAFGSAWSDNQIWEAVEARRAGDGRAEESDDLRGPEWALLSSPDPARNTADFRLRQVPPPNGSLITSRGWSWASGCGRCAR